MPEIRVQRLINQQLVQPSYTNPAEVVRWFGAIQAQDFLGSLWAIGCRLPGTTEDSIEQAILDRTILRTWPMRGTIHFVPSKDAQWMVNLTAPRQIERAQGRYRKLGLTEDIFTRARKIFIKALEGENRRTRGELYALLEAGGIATENSRGLHIIGHLAQEGLICFGPRSGKQPTFVLLEEWAPNTRILHREESLAGLALRYFLSHGPATIRDFVWWTGLKVADAQAGLEAVKSYLIHESIDGSTYWWGELNQTVSAEQTSFHLLPAYDEYMVGYKDRSAILNPRNKWLLEPENHLRSILLIDGKASGTWKRTFQKDEVVIEATLTRDLAGHEKERFLATAQRYGKFLGKPVILKRARIKGGFRIGLAYPGS